MSEECLVDHVHDVIPGLIGEYQPHVLYALRRRVLISEQDAVVTHDLLDEASQVAGEPESTLDHIGRHLACFDSGHHPIREAMRRERKRLKRDLRRAPVILVRPVGDGRWRAHPGRLTIPLAITLLAAVARSLETVAA